MKKKDIVTLNKSKQQALDNKSVRALDVVTSTIKELENVNAEIDSTTTEIDATVNELTDTKTQMLNTKKKNETIIEKFKNLIS